MFKKINLLRMATTAMVLSAFVLASCVSEQETPEVTASDLVTRSVTFNIQLPSGDPVHFTRTATQDATEAAFSSLKLYVFDAATDVLLEIVDMKSGTSTVSAAAVSGNNYQYSYQMTPAAGTLARRFVVVANDALEGADVGITYAAFQALQLTQEIVASADLSSVYSTGYLPMSGVAHLSTDNGTTIIPMDGASTVDVKVTMTRAVARIDVVNNVPNLEITDLKLINVNPNGYLMPHETTGNVAVPSGMNKVGSVTPVTTIASITGDFVAANNWASAGHFKPADNNPATLKKAFYVYEDAIQTPSSAPLTMLVQGVLSNEIPVYYNIPFLNATNSANSLEIQRNHLYTLTIGNGSAVTVNTQMQSALSFADWTSTASESVPGVFDASIFAGATTGDDNSYIAATQKFALAAAAVESGTTISVADAYYTGGTGVNIVDVETITTGDSWTASTGDPKVANSDWLTATMNSAQTVTITASANTVTAARTGSIRIKYKNTSTAETFNYIVFSVTQAAAAAANP